MYHNVSISNIYWIINQYFLFLCLKYFSNEQPALHASLAPIREASLLRDAGHSLLSPTHQDFGGFSLLPFLRWRIHACSPFFIQTSTYGIGKAPRMLLWKGNCLRNCNPVSLKSNALDAGLLAARFGLGGIVANWNLLNKTLTKSGSFLATWPFGVCSYSAKARFQTCLFTLKDSTHR